MKTDREEHAFRGKAVDVRGLDDRVAGAAEGVIALIIGVEEKNVRPCELGFCRGGSLFSGFGFAVRPRRIGGAFLRLPVTIWTGRSAHPTGLWSNRHDFARLTFVWKDRKSVV